MINFYLLGGTEQQQVQYGMVVRRKKAPLFTPLCPHFKAATETRRSLARFK